MRAPRVLFGAPAEHFFCSGGRLLANAFGVPAAEGDRFCRIRRRGNWLPRMVLFYQMNAVALAIPNSF